MFSAKVKQFPTCFFSSFVEFSVLTFELAIDSFYFLLKCFPSSSSSFIIINQDLGVARKM